MNKKIVGIFVTTLLLSASVLSIAGNVNENKNDVGCINTNWLEQDKLLASDGATGDRFGYYVSIDGDYAIAGAPYPDSETASVYVYKNTGTGWIEEAKLTASDGATGDWFGRSVSINEDYAFVGTSHDDSNTGSVYIFKNSIGGWNEEAKLTASDGVAGDRFGHSSSFSGNYIIIGSIFDDSETGSAYMFKRTVPDLECTGTIGWIDVKTGATVNDDFNISNIGDTGTKLNWKIESYPDWGTWTFIPSSGDGLTPDEGQVTVEVSVVAPEEKNLEFAGEIKVVSKDDSNDYSIIPVSLTTPKNKLYINSPFLTFLENHPHLFPLLRQILGL